MQEVERVKKMYAEVVGVHEGSARDLESVRKELVHRFEDIGFIADVKVYETAEPGTFAYDIEVTERTEPRLTDHEMIAWEVQHGLVDGTPGVLTADGILRDPRRVF